MDQLIQKRDGSIEPFNPQKISNVLTAAGLEPENITQVLQYVTDWTSKQTDGPISSLRIRDEILKKLDEVDPYIAGLFRWYEKSKETVK